MLDWSWLVIQQREKVEHENIINDRVEKKLIKPEPKGLWSWDDTKHICSERSYILQNFYHNMIGL